MSRAALKILQSGPLVSLQDGGRRGLMRYGVPESGAMDRLACRAANRALGNPEGATGIDVSLGGLELECLSGRLAFAVAGGGFRVDWGETRGGSWQRGILSAGQRLRIRPGPWGSWCFLALAGGVQAETWLGSAATHVLSGLGGGILRPGQVLHVTDCRLRPPARLPCPVFARPRARLHVTIGPQERYFAPETLRDFLRGPWQTTSAGDRMGMRLKGPVVAPFGPLDMPSEPVMRGAVQVAGDGVATVLLADHQTTGGYPKIATLIDCDQDGFVQLRPGAPLRFHPLSPGAALARARLAAQAQDRYLQALDQL